MLNVFVGDCGDVFDLVKATTVYLDTYVAAARANGENEDVYFIGELMGGMLFLCVVSECLDLIMCLILVNFVSLFD